MKEGYYLYHPEEGKYLGRYFANNAKMGWFSYHGVILFSDEDVEALEANHGGEFDPMEANGYFEQTLGYINRTYGWSDVMMVPVKIWGTFDNQRVTVDFLHAFKV